MSESDTKFTERDQRCTAVQLMLPTDRSYDNRTVVYTLKMHGWIATNNKDVITQQNGIDLLLSYLQPSGATRSGCLKILVSRPNMHQTLLLLVASILANMAVLESCQTEITQQNGIDLLLSYLHEDPTSFRNGVEIAACERVLQKAAIALTRLSREARHAQLIAESAGIPRLVKLCRNAETRNNSDAVLVACLAALRKICSICGHHSMQVNDVKQLIEPRLMDSFLICTHSDENFV